MKQARASPGLGKSSDLQSVSAGKRKLVDEDEDDADEQTKKKVGNLLFIHKMTRGSRRSLVASPAFSNDSSELELPGAWEPRTLRSLCQLVKTKRPNLVFLMETKMMQR